MKLEKIAREAGKILLENFEKVEGKKVLKKKEGFDFSIQTDKMAEDRIVELLKKEGFDGEIVTEEAGNIMLGNSKSKIFVDPLDGTWNFSRGIAYFCTSIGLQKGNEMVMGVVYDPMRNEMFMAEKGKGASLNGKKIKVSDRKDGLFVNIEYIDNEDLYTVLKHKTDTNFVVRNALSTALNLSYTAAGRTDVTTLPQFGPWDIAAGCLIVEEAGGIVTDRQGNPWNPFSKSIIAGNKFAHKMVLDMFR